MNNFLWKIALYIHSFQRVNQPPPTDGARGPLNINRKSNFFNLSEILLSRSPKIARNIRLKWTDYNKYRQLQSTIIIHDKSLICLHN